MLLVLWSGEDTTGGAASQRYQHTTTRIINLSLAGFDTTLLHAGCEQCVYILHWTAGPHVTSGRLRCHGAGIQQCQQV